MAGSGSVWCATMLELRKLRRRGVAPWEIAGYLGHSVREYAIAEGYAEYAPDYLSHAARTIDEYCRDLQPNLDFELLRTNCVPPALGADLEIPRRRTDP